MENVSGACRLHEKKSGKIRASTTGVGGVGHFNVEVITHETGAQINMIPYKGAPPTMTALLGGHVDMSLNSLASPSRTSRQEKFDRF